MADGGAAEALWHGQFYTWMGGGKLAWAGLPEGWRGQPQQPSSGGAAAPGGAAAAAAAVPGDDERRGAAPAAAS